MGEEAGSERMLSILYVDDEDGFRELTKRYLERAGDVCVDTAATAREALSLLREQGYDAVVSDYQMSHMDGVAFLRTLRASGSTIPFILFTGKGREEVVIKAYESGADFYLQKGGEPRSQFAELLHKVRQAVDLHRAQQALLESEAQLAGIIDFLPDATFAIDHNGVVIAWNRAMEEMTGVPASSILGKGDHAYAIPFYGHSVPALIDLVLSPEAQLSERYESIHREGDRIIAETSHAHPRDTPCVLYMAATPLYDSAGRRSGAIQSIRDITDFRRTEQELHESEQKYRTLFEESHDAIWTTSAEGRILEANSASFDLLGYPRDEFLGMEARLLYATPSDRDAFLTRVHEQGFLKDYEVVLRHKGGREVLCTFTSHIWRGSDGAILGYRGIVRDISRFKQAEESLKRSEELFSAFFDAVTDMAFLKDLTFAHVMVNKAYLAFLDLRRDEVIGKSDYDILPAPMADACRASDMNALAGGQPVVSEETYGGRIFETRKFPVKVGGRMGGIGGFVRDVTEERRAQEALMHNERLLNSLFIDHTAVMLLIDPDTGAILRANTAAAGFYGWTCSELSSLRISDINTLSEEEIRCEMAKVRRGERSHFEFCHRLADGSVRDVEVYTSRITIGEIDVLHSIIHDITDRKRAERALQESECRYRTYIESAPGGVFIVDAQGTYLEVNDTACAMTGFSRKELLGMSIADLASPRAPPATLATFASLRGSGSVQGEILLRRADGTDFPSLLTAVVLPGGRYMGFCSDISELKQAEMALSEREEMWRLTLDSIGDAVITTDTEGKVTYMNPVAEELTGWRLPSVRGTPLSRVFHIVSALTGAPVENPVREVLESGTIVGLANHTKLLSRDGTAYQIADSAAPIHHADGSVTGVVLTFRDVTKEYELHEQMRQSEHQLRTLYDSMQEGLCMHEMLYGPDGEPVDYRIIDINARYEELVGMRRDLVVGRLATEIYGEPLYLGRYARVAATGEGGRFEAYYAPQDRYYAVSIFSPGKGFFATVFEDITGRKRVEKALHESEEKYRLITDHTGDNITVLDLSLNVVYTSPSIVRIRGYGVEEALNQSLDDILTPASQERVRALFSVQMELEAARGADPGRSFTLEIEEYHKDGSVIPVEATLSFMRNAEGTPVGIVVVSRDISERKRAERALQESRQQLSDIIDNLPDATLAIDASGRIIFWNRAIEKMTGVPASEMLGKGGHAYTVPFYGEAREQLMDLLFYEREDIASRYPYLVWEGDSLVAEVFCSALNGGKGAWVIAKASPLRDASGALVGAIESIRDVSSQKRAEQELLKANKKLGILSDITRHDINNRLATLLGYAELSLDTATDWTVRDYLEKIYATARVMQEQIAFTRTYEGVGGMDPSWQDVVALLTSLSLPEGTAPPASCVGVEVYADPMLRQVFATLLDNTLRHAGTASPRVTVTCTHTKDGLVIAWEDDGVGVPEDAKERIFERGYGKNTGLGLFLAREILAITGIGIREEGPPGAGARFVITVPPGAYRDAPP